MVPEIQDETDGVFLSFWAIFCPFTPPPFPRNNLENQNFEKMKKACGNVIIILHTCTKNHDHMICMLAKILSVTDIIFCHFGPFFALLPHY